MRRYWMPMIYFIRESAETTMIFETLGELWDSTGVPLWPECTFIVGQIPNHSALSWKTGSCETRLTLCNIIFKFLWRFRSFWRGLKAGWVLWKILSKIPTLEVVDRLITRCASVTTFQKLKNAKNFKFIENGLITYQSIRNFM